MCTTLAPIAVRKCKVPDISTFCSQLTLHWKAPAISLYTWRIIPAETLEMCSATEAKQGGPVPNLGPQSTQARHTHRRSIFSKQQQLEASHWGTEAGSQHGVTRGRKEKHSAIHTCTRRDIQPRKRTLHKHTHTAGMPCRHHWHLDGFGTMRAQWRPVAGSLPHWASQWSVSHTEAGCSLGKGEQGEEWDTE